MPIVCATHFTDSSASAVKAAAALARAHGERLFLVSVVPTPLFGGPPAVQPVGDALNFEAAALTVDGVRPETAVLYGPLERTLRKYCDERRASLLVVGDSSHTRRSLFAGPVEALADGIDVPLLVVRDPRPFEAWVAGAAPLRVMLGLDHTWSSSLARDWISRMAWYGPLSLVAAFVWWPAIEYQRRGLQPPSPDDGHRALSKLVRAQVESELRHLPPQVVSRVHLEIGVDHVAETLLRLALAEQVDVLVIGSHPVDGVFARRRTVAHDVLIDAAMSVACIPARGEPLPVSPLLTPPMRPQAFVEGSS